MAVVIGGTTQQEFAIDALRALPPFVVTKHLARQATRKFHAMNNPP
jgi:hypothetical protein